MVEDKAGGKRGKIVHVRGERCRIRVELGMKAMRGRRPGMGEHGGHIEGRATMEGEPQAPHS